MLTYNQLRAAAPTDDHTHVRDGHHVTRARALRAHLHEKGVHLACLQEAPGPITATPMDGYTAFASGDSTTLGTTLLVSTSIPYGHSAKGPLLLKPSHVKVLHADERLLVARIRNAHIDDVVYTAHAPHHSHRGTDVKSWWAQLSACMRKWPPTFLMIDANGRLHHDDTTEVGPVHIGEDDDANGTALRKVLREFSLSAVNTHWPHEGGHTYVHHTGSRHRIDFACVHSDLHHMVSGCSVLYDVDNQLQVEDHYPVLTEVEFSSTARAAPRRRLALDSRKLADPGTCAAFERALDQMTLDHWSTPMNVQLIRTDGAVRELALQHFGRDSLSARRPYITAHTMKLIRLRRHVQRALRAPADSRYDWHCVADRLHQSSPLAPPDCEWEVDTGRLRLVLHAAQEHTVPEDTAVLQMRAFLRATLPTLRRCLHADKQAHLSTITTAMHRAARELDHRSKWQHLNSLLCYSGRVHKKRTKRCPIARGTDGQPLDRLTDIANHQLSHFAAIEDAQLMTDQSLVELYNCTRSLDSTRVELDSSLVPTRQQVVSAFARSQRHRAPGPDAISGDILKAAPKALGRLYHPLMCKAVLLLEEPLSWKGGEACPIPKAHADASYLEGNRSIMLNACTSKVLHSFLRQAVNDILHVILRPTQVGGRRGMGVTTAVHLCTSFLAQARQEGRTAITYFVDLRSAFYSCIRSTVLPVQGEHAAADVEYIEAKADMPEGLRPLLSFVLAQPSALAELRDKPHLVASLVEAHRCTFFCTGHSSVLARSRRGSRPGNALADAIFSLSFAAPLGSIAEFICRQGWTLDSVPQTRLLSKADAPPSSLTDVAYADDGLLLAALRDHTDVRRQATALAETIHISMRSFGYDPNYKRHKSGIMVAFTGRGHRPACTRFHSGGDVIHSERWQFQVHIVRDYQYLGSAMDHCYSSSRQASHLLDKHFAAFRPIRSGLRKMSGLSTSEVTVTADVLCTVHLLYCAETWSSPSSTTLRKLEHCRTKAYRLVQHKAVHSASLHHARFTDADVLVAAHRPSLSLILRKRRLRWLVTLLVSSPPHLRWALDSLIGTDHDWLAQVHEDLRWLAHYTIYPLTVDPREGPPPDAHRCEWHTIDWIRWIRSHPHQARCLITKAWHVAAEQDIDRLRRAAWRRTLHLTSEPPPPTVEITESFVCYDCGATFRNVRAFRRHQTVAHRPPGLAQLYAIGSTCRCCRSDYHTRDRLVLHLQGVTGCLEELTLSHPPSTLPKPCDFTSKT